MDDAWSSAVRENPSLFDGPVVLANDLERTAEGLVVQWSRATYRFRTLRGRPEAPPLASVFVCVAQPVADGRLLVGRMSRSTSNPGVLQFPGGSLEPPGAGEQLTLQHLRRHAATELREETALEISPGDLASWVVVRTANGNLGFFFLAPVRPVESIVGAREALVAGERDAGREPEFDDAALIASTVELDGLRGRPADYLLPLLDRYRRLPDD